MARNKLYTLLILPVLLLLGSQIAAQVEVAAPAPENFVPVRSIGQNRPAGLLYEPTDGTGAVLEQRLDLPLSAVDALIAGETNVLLNVPIEQRAGIRALSAPNAGNFQIAEVPGHSSIIVLLNFADPTRPLPAFHPVTGEPLEQGHNQFFSDPKVRRALQLAIDPAPIIENAMQRSALPLAGL
jgi:hypothetical protein